MKSYFTLSILFLFCVYAAKSQNIAIPDSNFKAALISAGVDTGMDGEISLSEAQAVTYLDVSFKNIADLTGIGFFTNLQILFCQYNSLTTLDVSELTNLEHLICYNNSLISLNLSGLTNLEFLNCQYNFITSLDFSGLTNLSGLFCSSNSLSNLDVSGLTNLEALFCDNNSFTSLDVRGLTKLISFSCNDNSLTTLDVSGLISLINLYCQNSSLKSIDIRNTPLLLLEARNNPDLECIIVDDLMQVPAAVFIDQSPVPFTTSPCVILDFDDLVDVIDAGGIPSITAGVFKATVKIAEESCSQGLSRAAIYQLYTFKLMAHRSLQIGRISTSRAGELTESIDSLIANIRSGAVDCSGTGRKNLVDRINEWFDYSLEMPGAAIQSTSSVSRSQFAQKVYPNPTAGRLYFSQPDQQVVVYDMLGKVMAKATGADHIDMSAYQTGVYAVQLGEGKDRLVFQVVKE
jgi:hypothetical protein